mgnify:CR=1 FL=1
MAGASFLKNVIFNTRYIPGYKINAMYKILQSNRVLGYLKATFLTQLVIVILLFVTPDIFAQSFHFFRYGLADSNKPTFEALLTLYPDGTATARVRNTQIPEENSPVYELDLADSTTAENMNLPFRQLIPRKAEEITKFSGNSMAYLPLFEFEKQVENNIEFFSPERIKYLDEGKWTNALISEKTAFSTAEIDTNLVKRFYANTSPYYTELFGNITNPGLISRGGLNELQKKMKIWMIIVTDLLDPQVGKACTRDKENIAYTFTGIAQKMGLQPPVITYINGTQFNRQSVLNAVSAIKPASNDIVIFYYSGHGYRAINDESPLPKMILSNDYTFENLPKKSLGIQAIVDSLNKKKSRFNLVINDCCNVECCPVPAPGLGKNPIISPKSIGLPVSTENFIKLFWEPRGTVVASSSMPKEYSVGNPEKGGFFTWYLRISLEKNLSQYKRDIAWEDILFEAGKNANYLALTGLCGEENNKKRCVQNPWYDISNMELQ